MSKNGYAPTVLVGSVDTPQSKLNHLCITLDKRFNFDSCYSGVGTPLYILVKVCIIKVTFYILLSQFYGAFKVGKS